MKSTVYLPPLHRSQPPYMDYPAPPPLFYKEFLRFPLSHFKNLNSINRGNHIMKMLFLINWITAYITFRHFQPLYKIIKVTTGFKCWYNVRSLRVACSFEHIIQRLVFQNTVVDSQSKQSYINNIWFFFNFVQITAERSHFRIIEASNYCNFHFEIKSNYHLLLQYKVNLAIFSLFVSSFLFGFVLFRVLSMWCKK